MALCVKTNTKSGRTHSTVEVEENFDSNSTRIEEPEVVLQVPPVEVAFFR